MANKTVKGITVEIGGDSTGLTNSLKQAESSIKNTNKELKEINSLLKFDPKNTELITQKQKALKEQIANVTDKLKQLKSQDADMQKSLKSGEISQEQYDKFRRTIIQTESQLKSYKKQLDETNIAHKGISLDKLESSFKNLGSHIGDVSKKIASISWSSLKAGVTAATTAIVSLTTASVKAYADLEQSIGGVETLFGDSAQTVINNASKAYETAGLSANEYMENVTSFSASLLQALGKDTEKAAEKADMAMIDMSDNANKMGTDMSAIQNAYQGFAKQNYTMLDNLKLGYGGTKTEMERLLADAEKISGVKYDISNLADVYDAIHVIQTDLKITGTTSKEAATTITGSVKSMKAAFSNWLSGAGGIEDVVETITTFGENLIPVIEEMLPNIVEGIEVLLEDLIDELPDLLSTILPTLITGVFSLLTKLAQTLIEYLPTLTQTILSMLPQILQAVINLGLQVILGLAEALPEMLPQIVDAILDLIPMLIDNLPLFIEAMFKIGLGLLEGLLKAVPKIIEKIPEIVTKIIEAFGQLGAKIKDVGVNIVSGLWEGLKSRVEWLKEKLKEWCNGALDAIKSFFGIASPSKKTKKDGIYIAQGLAKGITAGIPDVKKAVNKMNSEVQGNIESNISSDSSSSGLAGAVTINFYAQTLDDNQVNKVVREVNKQLGNAY